MNCEQGLSLLNAQLDGELLPDDQHRLDAHLCSCTACQDAAAELERADHALTRLFSDRPQAASAVADRALQAWYAESTPPSGQPAHLGWLTAAAAVFALALVLHLPDRLSAPPLTDTDQQVRALVEEWQHSDSPEDMEPQLRSFGSACGDPLADAIHNWDGEANDERRLAAARVLCDLADTSQIPMLIELLGDPSGEIQALSEASLFRITGRQRVASEGPTELVASCTSPQADWRDWWEQNKRRFTAPGK